MCPTPAFTTTLALGLEKFKGFTKFWTETSTVSEVVKLHIACRVIHTSNTAGVTDSPFDTVTGGKTFAVDTTKPNLVEMDSILASGSRPGNIVRSSSENFHLHSYKDMEGIQNDTIIRPS
jgi:hypothetical protein